MSVVPPVFTLHVFVSMIHALAYLHYGIRYEAEMGEYTQTKVYEAIIHGDIKPENIFLRWPPGTTNESMGRNTLPEIVLADFDMVALDSESWGIKGTPDYDSPEVHAVARLKDVDWKAYERARDAKVMSVKSDVYQLGLIIHLMAAGAIFKMGTDPSTIELKEDYRDLTGFLSALVWCLQPDVEHRAECSASAEHGLLEGAVQVLQKQRDALARNEDVLDKDIWRFPMLDENHSDYSVESVQSTVESTLEESRAGSEEDRRGM
jgi:NIMA (never in mitosis gene a)-related kinase